MTNTNLLRTFIIVLTITLSVNGCAFLGIPWQLSAATTIGDIATLNNHGKTMNETAASIALQRDCQWSRLWLGWPPCLTQEEHISYLMRMNCKTYSWNFLNNPYCREND
jgi:hypothetical protein